MAITSPQKERGRRGAMPHRILAWKRDKSSSDSSCSACGIGTSTLMGERGKEESPPPPLPPPPLLLLLVPLLVPLLLLLYLLPLLVKVLAPLTAAPSLPPLPLPKPAAKPVYLGGVRCEKGATRGGLRVGSALSAPPPPPLPLPLPLLPLPLLPLPLLLLPLKITWLLLADSFRRPAVAAAEEEKKEADEDEGGDEEGEEDASMRDRMSLICAMRSFESSTVDTWVRAAAAVGGVASLLVFMVG